MRPSAAAPDWLIARPIAHRGLHDAVSGVIENSTSAALAAVAAGFAIECDVQASHDGEAMVFHDFELERLTGLQGTVRERTAADLARVTLMGSSEGMPTLPGFLDGIGGRVPLVCEIKSRFDRDLRLTDRVVQIALSYPGPLALKSFDPMIVAHLRRQSELAARGIPIGVVAEADYHDPEWAYLDRDQKERLAALAHFSETRPDFLSYAVNDLPHAAVTLFRAAWAGPVMCWTVRTPEQRAAAERWADQIVFERLRP